MTQTLCPYCRGTLGETTEQIICEGCDTPHHRDCYEENGGCTVFGCRCGPAEEPKVHIAGPEINAIEPAGSASTGPRPLSYSPLGLTALSASPEIITPVESLAGKSKMKFVLLGVFLGPLGAHNFYAGFKKKGIFQLGITVLTLGYGAPMSWIWAIIDICTMERDSKGAQFIS
jgi:hypothetical protein